LVHRISICVSPDFALLDFHLIDRAQNSSTSQLSTTDSLLSFFFAARIPVEFRGFSRKFTIDNRRAPKWLLAASDISHLPNLSARQHVIRSQK